MEIVGTPEIMGDRLKSMDVNGLRTSIPPEESVVTHGVFSSDRTTEMNTTGRHPNVFSAKQSAEPLDFTK